MITAFNNKPYNAQQKLKFTTLHSNAFTSFKCRLMAIVRNNTESNKLKQDEFVRECTLRGKNALQKQASWNRPGFNDEVQSPRNRDDDVYLKRNDDGWGIAGYTKGSRNLIEKAPKSALADECFKNAIEKAIQSNSDVILAHLRQTLDPDSVNLLNTHPFTYKNWTFMHNGNIDFDNNPYFTGKLQEYKQKYNLKPEGTTDSEKVFMLMLGKLKDRNIDIDSDKDISLSTIKNVFAETIIEVVNKTPKHRSPIENTWYTGEVETVPTTNFILSNGKHLLAFRHGPNLHLGFFQFDDGKRDYIISSEIVQPKNKKIRWKEIENDNIITISRDDAGVFKSPDISPISSMLHENTK